MNAHPDLAVFLKRFQRHKMALSIIASLLVGSVAGCSPGSLQSIPVSTSTLPTEATGNVTTSHPIPPPAQPGESDRSYPTLSLNFDYDRFVWVGMGGFAFETVPGYLVEINVAQASVSDPSGRVLITLTGSNRGQPKPVEDVMADFQDVMSATFVNLKISTPVPLLIQDFSGLAVDIQGYLANQAFTGRVVTILPAPGSQFLAQAIGMQSHDADYWTSSGRQDFEAILASIQFFEPTDSACMVASENSYAYDPGNPVQIGPSENGRLPRSLLYLDNLRGPNFELTTYRLVSDGIENNDAIQVYEVDLSNSSDAMLLYLDTLNYSYPRAPRGFKCPQPFNLAPPPD